MPVRALPRPTLVAAALLAGALVAWIVAVERMRGMDAGPGTDLGGVGWYVGIWVTMMAAMMLPSVAPMVLLHARVSREKARRGLAYVPTWVFLAGYLAAWTAYGVAAYAVYRGIVAVDDGFLSWERGGPYVAGAALVVAGVYELTPLKSVCLRHCRSPMHYILGGWRSGWIGSLRMGAEHGAYCVGCCWGIMLALFAVGVMSLFWMAVIAGVIFVQKLAPVRQDRLTRVAAAGFVGLGIWMAVAPESVPGLTEPNSSAAERARMRMMHMEPAKKKMEESSSMTKMERAEPKPPMQGP
jgi:predicted metal-binding membrane protein